MGGEYYLTCNKCGWSGEHDELVDESNNDKFDQCPNCFGTDFQEDTEED